MSCPKFSDVQDILNHLIKGKEHRIVIHDASKDAEEVEATRFGWETREQLLNAVANPWGDAFRLIEPSMIGNGSGANTALVQILQGSYQGYDRMPRGGNSDGDYATPEQIETLIIWIDAGAPE